MRPAAIRSLKSHVAAEGPKRLLPTQCCHAAPFTSPRGILDRTSMHGPQPVSESEAKLARAATTAAQRSAPFFSSSLRPRSIPPRARALSHLPPHSALSLSLTHTCSPSFQSLPHSRTLSPHQIPALHSAARRLHHMAQHLAYRNGRPALSRWQRALGYLLGLLHSVNAKG